MVCTCAREKILTYGKANAYNTYHSRVEMIIDDDPAGGRHRVAVQRRPKRSRSSVRPSVVARARPQCACVQSGAEQCACVRSCVRVRARERRRRRRPAHSRGGKRSQQVGSAARRLHRPAIGSSYCFIVVVTCTRARDYDVCFTFRRPTIVRCASWC